MAPLAKLFRFWYLLIVLLRYLRLIFDILQFWGYLKLSPPVQPQDPHDVTIVSMTLGTEPVYETTVRCWLQANIGRVNIVTVENAVPRVKKTLDRIGDKRLTLLWVDKPSTRHQLCEGIRHVQTPFWVLTDDRSFWPPDTLKHLTSAFADPSVGGAMTMQKVRPVNGVRFTVWESFGALNLVRRNIIHASLAYWNNGQVLNLSGRLSAYRTEIFQNNGFYHALKNELWLNKYPIRTGDDSFMYNWILQRGWRTSFQNDVGVTITTGVSHNSLYIRQLLRWSRDVARHTFIDFVFALNTRNFTALYRSLLNILTNYFSDIALLVELLFIMCVYTCGQLGAHRSGPAEFQLLYEHLAVCSVLTLLEHAPFFEKLTLSLYAPTTIAYCYIHGFTVLYSLFTLNQSVWGSRPHVDTNDSNIQPNKRGKWM